MFTRTLYGRLARGSYRGSFSNCTKRNTERVAQMRSVKKETKRAAMQAVDDTFWSFVKSSVWYDTWKLLGMQQDVPMRIIIFNNLERLR